MVFCQIPIKPTMKMTFVSSSSLLLLVTSLLFSSYFGTTRAQSSIPVVKGLSWTFYDSSCPNLENIIKYQLKKVFKQDIGQAAGLLRLQFHDCFVQGCDGSVLLDGSASGPSEKSAIPNLTLRPESFKIIENLRRHANKSWHKWLWLVNSRRECLSSSPSNRGLLYTLGWVAAENLRRHIHKLCGRVVSCSDITALAARDAVFLSGGPNYDVPLGRRDGLTFATAQATLDNLVAPFAKTDAILDALSRKNFDPTDVVALSGAHTIGISHCTSFTDRLYPNQDPTMDNTFAKNLKGTCPTPDSGNVVAQDLLTPNKFDNKYYVDLMNRKGLFTSDQDLFTDARTKGIVTSFAANESLFFEKFVVAMIKMSQLSVVTGKEGEIRANCSVKNSARSYVKSVVEEVETWSGL